MSRSDFDNDGFDDLAIGVTGKAVGARTGAGVANVLYGSSSRLTAVGDDYWNQNRRGIGDSAEEDDTFGRALASGDFDGDRFDDLAIGVHFEDIGTAVDAGAVNVIRGSTTGLTATGDQFWHQNRSGVLGVAESDDHFGETLAVGDFDNDGFDDLAIGVHFKDVGAAANAGAVSVLQGSATGLTAVGDRLWSQNSRGVLDSAESDDAFGTVLATGDFNGDGFDDLAIGAPGEDVGSVANAGAVNVLNGSTAGLTATGDRIWHQDRPGVAGSANADDRFGSVLATGDFDGDGFDDLAIGVRNENVGSVSNAGAVNVLQGSRTGLTARDNQLWSQDSAGVLNGAEVNDVFGSALAVGDFDNDGFDDLAIGVSDEDLGSAVNAGAVNVLYGSEDGLTASGDDFWHQNSRGVRGVAGNSDFFGDALSVGDFNNDNFDDLAIGAPGDDFGSASGAGAANVLFGSASGLTATGDQYWTQNASGVLGTAQTDDFFGFSLA